MSVMLSYFDNPITHIFNFTNRIDKCFPLLPSIDTLLHNFKSWMHADKCC